MKITDDNGFMFFDESKLVSFKVYSKDQFQSIEINIWGASCMSILHYDSEKDLLEQAEKLARIISKRDK